MVLNVSISILLYQPLFISLFESQDIVHTLSDLSWVNVINGELENFEKNQVWTLVERSHDVNVLGTK
jgi:hypothetical protein